MAAVSTVNLVAAQKSGAGEEALLAVAALGEVGQAGWENLRLEGRIYVTPPADGFWELDFVGNPPSSGAHVMTPVLAVFTAPAPPWCRGVTVIAANNSKRAPVER